MMSTAQDTDTQVKPGLTRANKLRLAYAAIGCGWLGEAMATIATLVANNSLSMILWHIVGCAVTTLGLCLFVSTQTPLVGQARKIAPVYFTLCFLIPYAVVGLSIATLFGFLRPRVKVHQPLQLIKIPTLPFKPLEVDSGLSFTNGGMYDVLRHSVDIDKRRTAVMATTRMKDKVAVPLLKLAMRDPVDDVRLLAYSIKDKIESRINMTIRDQQIMLENPGKVDPADIHRVLAFSYWEMIYLELVEGDLRNFILGEAIKHAELCLETKADSAVNILIGRAELTRGNLDAAATALRQAVTNGARPASVASYLAEISYLRADFIAVPAALRLVPQQFKRIPSVRRLCEKWAVA